ncbi:MAG TPA: autotransporter outer membrane beta-barrel domain-containing protein [Anaeromyxobacteraceae bacterium]|nr:autotransporter outer membrane beta-barrel domain-containing protein [Anaeromyxobacteraceae bacterium]
MGDVGFPDGLGLSLVYRPIWFARLHAGPTFNFLAPGLRLGATAVPFQFLVTPTLTAEYGHAFDGDAGRLVSRFGTLDPAERAVLRKVGYDYFLVQLGIESGSPRTFAWFVRVGLGWVWVRVHDFQAAAQTQDPSLTSTNPRIRVAVPTVSTGVYLFVW